MADKQTVLCDHCGADIGVDPIPDESVWWCAECLVRGRQLLGDFGIGLRHSDEWYRKNGYTYWMVRRDIVGDLGYKVSQIPKKEVSSSLAVEVVQQSLDLSTSPPVVSQAVVVCPKRYYGIGSCSCGECGGAGYVPNRNVFGY